jgi:regulator of nucleoside diphosphate kinase
MKRTAMQMNTEKIIITQTDYQKLSSLVSKTNTPTSELLEEELSRASVVNADQVPSDVITMNSTARFVDLDSEKESTITLVFPHEANVEENKVSILVPLGAALIGLRAGQEIIWPMPNGKERRLKVVEVLSQPSTTN